MRTYRATRVLATKRRGSSWPLVIETDGGRYFTKLWGAGHGPSALVAEVIVGALAERLGLRVPRRSLILIDEEVDCGDRDPELLDLLKASYGVNLGFEVLDGARDLRPEDIDRVSCDEASIVAWLDWLVMNPDRSWRNPNLLIRKDELWLIDHGSALMFHHNWPAVTEESPRRPMLSLSTHPLGGRATGLAEWDSLLAETLHRDAIRSAVEAVPDEFLAPLLPAAATAFALARRREAYSAFLWKRLKPPRPFTWGQRARSHDPARRLFTESRRLPI